MCLSVHCKQSDELTYPQFGDLGCAVILEKTEEDPHEIEVLDDGYSLNVKLTQEDTSLFNSKESATVQIRCQYESGDTFASEKLTFKIKDVINGEII